jgi:hypothetical protein
LTTDRDFGFGIGYIKSSEYLAWSTLVGVKMTPVELSILRELDRNYVEYHVLKKSRAGDDAKEISSRPMSPELFDSLF